MANRRSLAITSLSLDKGKSTTLRIKGNEIAGFPRCSESNFAKLRADKRFAYFDRSSYISVLDSVLARAILFLRPRRFGKSLTVSMLEHFHGVQYCDQYNELFKDLDIDMLVNENKIAPGQYMVLKFNFAEARRTQDMNAAAEGLSTNIIWSLKEFYKNYHMYLGGSVHDLISENIDDRDAISSLRNLVSRTSHTLLEAKSRRDTQHPLAKVKGIYMLADEYDAFSNEYMNPHNPQPWGESNAFSLLKDFWATVKGMVDLQYGIQKCFITGISPLSLADNSSGFNIAVNMSFKKEVASLCGLTHSEVRQALERICPSKADVVTHLDRLSRYANGYHFSRFSKTEPVFNTDTSLEYLQAVLTGDDFDIANPPNSEVSQRFLDICASSPGAVYYIQQALAPTPDGATQYCRMPYVNLVERFGLQDLQSRALGDIEDTTFRTLLLYFGAFTFDKDQPTKFLTIPNHIVAKRFGTSILRGYHLRGSMQNAVRFLALQGNIIGPLAGYQKLMVSRDTKQSGYTMTEAQHRDSFHIAILENPGLDPEVEYQVTKPSGAPGLVDLIIVSPSHCIVTEWKTIPIEFLDLPSTQTWDEKAQLLSRLNVQEVLKLKFNKREKFRKGTIQSWIKKQVTPQLKSYVESQEVRKLVQNRQLQAHLIVIVGSRKILVWEMSIGGHWIGQPVFAE